MSGSFTGGNPNKTDPFARRTYLPSPNDGSGTQVADGMMQQQRTAVPYPDLNWSHTRGFNIGQTPPPLNPTPVAPVPNTWQRPPQLPSYSVPGGRDLAAQNYRYEFADGRVGHAVPPGYRPTPGTGYAMQQRGPQGFGGGQMGPGAGNDNRQGAGFRPRRYGY